MKEIKKSNVFVFENMMYKEIYNRLHMPLQGIYQMYGTTIRDLGSISAVMAEYVISTMCK